MTQPADYYGQPIDPSAPTGPQSFELGFPHYPVFSLSKVTGSGTGSYNYIAVYKWTDGASQIHQSGRSAPVKQR